MKFPLATLAISACLILSGCTSLGEVGLDDKVALAGTNKALLKTDSENKHKFMVLLDERVFITHLDGKYLQRMGKTTNYPEALLIDPGEHVVQVRFMNNEGPTTFVSYANAKFIFEAKAEKTYIVRHENIGDRVRFWMEDLNSQELIANPID